MINRLQPLLIESILDEHMFTLHCERTQFRRLKKQGCLRFVDEHLDLGYPSQDWQLIGRHGIKYFKADTWRVLRHSRPCIDQSIIGNVCHRRRGNGNTPASVARLETTHTHICP
jgi:hypothetical protein